MLPVAFFLMRDWTNTSIMDNTRGSTGSYVPLAATLIIEHVHLAAHIGRFEAKSSNGLVEIFYKFREENHWTPNPSSETAESIRTTIPFA